MMKGKPLFPLHVIFLIRSGQVRVFNMNVQSMSQAQTLAFTGPGQEHLISSKGSFICTIPDRIVPTPVFSTPELSTGCSFY